MQLGGIGRCRSQAYLELAQLIAAKRMHPHALTDASTTQRCIQTSTARTQSVDGHDQIAGRQTGLLRRAALEHMRQTQITAFALDAHPQHRPATQRISAAGRRPPSAIAQRLGGAPKQRQAMCLEQRRQRQCCRALQQSSQQRTVKVYMLSSLFNTS